MFHPYRKHVHFYKSNSYRFTHGHYIPFWYWYLCMSIKLSSIRSSKIERKDDAQNNEKQKMLERTFQVVFLLNIPYGRISRQPTLSQVLISDVRLVVGSKVRTTLHPSTVGISSVQGQETIVTYGAIRSQIKNNSVLQKKQLAKPQFSDKKCELYCNPFIF